MLENDEANGKPLESPVPEAPLARASVAGEILSLQGELDPERLKEIARKRVEFFRSVALLSLERTSINDWVDQSGKPYLQATGAEKLISLWGVYIKETKLEVQMDTETGLPAYSMTGRVGSRVIGTEIDVIGGRNAADKFFREQQRLDLLDVQKAAYSNFLVNAITRLLGLRGLTWADVEEGTRGRITRERAAGKVEYKKKGQEQGATPPAAPSLAGSSPPPNQGPAPSGFISEGQQKRLFAIAYQAGWKNDELKKFLKDTWGIDSSSKVPKGDYDQIITDIQAGGSH